MQKQDKKDKNKGISIVPKLDLLDQEGNEDELEEESDDEEEEELEEEFESDESDDMYYEDDEEDLAEGDMVRFIK